MSLLDAFMPSCDVREVVHIAVSASPASTWSAIRSIDVYQVPFVRNLFALMLLPRRVRARLQRATLPVVPTATIDDVSRDGSAFCVLGEEPQREIVIGAVGKVSQRRAQFETITADTFSSFATPGFGKLAFGLAVASRPGGAWITIDVRVKTTDTAADARFRRSWPAVAGLSRALRRAVEALIAERLDLAPSDDRSLIAGDDLLPAARAQVTHHVDIEAPPEQVWPWLVQMGRGRGGWYSWDLLDNGGVRSAERIIPALQKIAVGDILPVKPNSSEGFAVLVLDPPRALVVGDPSLLIESGARGMGAPRATWSFSLEPIGDTATHLVVRVRAEYEPTAKIAVLRPIVVALHEVMERKQLRTLKQRAEAS